MHDFREIFGQFDTAGEFSAASEISSGHINDTYLIETVSGPSFVLQRINHDVFPDIPGLIANRVLVSKHLKERLKDLPPEELRKRVLDFVPTLRGEFFHKDEKGNHWNVTRYIENCTVYLRVPNKKVAYEAGRLFGEFLYYTRDIDPAVLTEVIPDFHKMSFRFEEFDEAVSNASASRREEAKDSIPFALERRLEMQKLEKLFAEGKIRPCVTHNDTKISNALFSKTDEALCVIDTDTVMEGILHFDFGDAVRTICNTGDEDESDLSKVSFNLEYFEEFTAGFVGALGDEISEIEREYLAFSAKVMTFIVGLRFLTDFLRNDIYFRTAYDSQNLDRAKSQFKLFADMERKFGQMEEIVREVS